MAYKPGLNLQQADRDDTFFFLPLGYVDRSLCKLLLKTSLDFGRVSVHMCRWIQSQMISLCSLFTTRHTRVEISVAGVLRVVPIQ